MAAKLETTRTPGIFTRGKRYVVAYREPTTGKQRWPSFRTFEEARRFKRNQATDVDRGEYVEASRQTLHEFLREWVGRYQGGRRGFRAETRDDYRRMLEAYALRHFDARLRLSELSPQHVARFIAWLCDEEAQGRRVAEERRAREAERRGVPVAQIPLGPVQPVRLSDKTVRNVLGPLRTCLATARREGLIRRNPCDGAQLPHRPQVTDDDDEDDVRALGRDQLAAFLAVAHPRYRLLFVLLACTGLRISEAIALQWRHVVLDGSRPHVKVRRRIVRGKVGPVKSAGSRGNRSRRDVPLPASLVDGLRAWRRETEWPDRDDVVFPTLAGTPLGPDNVRKRYLAPAAGEADAGWMGFHTLRHTFASLHIARGTNVVQLSRLLGHHAPSFTLDVYSHLLEDGVGAPLDLDAELERGALAGVAPPMVGRSQ